MRTAPRASSCRPGSSPGRPPGSGRSGRRAPPIRPRHVSCSGSGRELPERRVATGTPFGRSTCTRTVAGRVSWKVAVAAARAPAWTASDESVSSSENVRVARRRDVAVVGPGDGERPLALGCERAAVGPVPGRACARPGDSASFASVICRAAGTRERRDDLRRTDDAVRERLGVADAVAVRREHRRRRRRRVDAGVREDERVRDLRRVPVDGRVSSSRRRRARQPSRRRARTRSTAPSRESSTASS